ncbi:MAG: PAS domain S-box protein [Isosphaeraceae bacterium]
MPSLSRRDGVFSSWVGPALVASVSSAVAMGVLGLWAGGAAAGLLILAVGSTRWFVKRGEHERQRAAARSLSERVEALRLHPSGEHRFDTRPGLEPLAGALERLASAWRSAWPSSGFTPPGESGTVGPRTPLTRSGLYESPSGVFEASPDPSESGELALPVADMVNRLEPVGFRWLESSPAEQKFLGWDIAHLRKISFLDVVYAEDLDRAREGLAMALRKGEIHGLVLRVRTSAGKVRAVVMNASARYGAEMSVRHLRCHLTDVTAKLRAERALRVRSRELTEANERLLAANRELEELKERYRDLYANAPVMYFSLDNEGRFLDCNETLCRTVGYSHGTLVGRPYEVLLPEERRAGLAARLDEFRRNGEIELETQWVKADGGLIDVWLRATAVRGPDGGVLHSRSVAQDITARLALESEIREKNARLARANEELVRRNREMDEFTYVVSHDLQEPLRTLTAFSDLVQREYGDRLDDSGREYVGHLVDASRRMQGLIRDLLALSKAGRITSDFAPVDLGALVDQARADLGGLLRAGKGEVRVVGSLPQVWGDRVRLGQLLANLITNGLKYNRSEAPVVEVSAAVAGEMVALRVRDNGIGIDPRYHARIFQLFRRLHTREDYEGNGAGLAICEKIAQAHGGRIWVESTPGRGSTFFVSLRKPPTVAALLPGAV